MNLYLDESGESTGFTSPNSSKTFNIAILKVADSKQVKLAMKHFCADQYRVGWPRDVEIKAYNLFGASKNPKIPVSYLHKFSSRDQVARILSILAQKDIQIDYISILKQNVKPRLKVAPPFVLYNYLAGVLIGQNVRKYSEVTLSYDMKNKETKPKLNFSGYLETIAYTKSSFPNPTFKMIACDSDRHSCIRAVDFISWAVYRKNEYRDSTYFDLFKDKLDIAKMWFY